MKGSIKVLSVLLSALLMVGCAEFDQNAARTVKIKTAKMDNCTYLGEVSSAGGSTGQMFSDDPAVREQHLNVLKRKAHDLGANAIVLQSYGTKVRGGGKQMRASEHSMTADAYRCPN